MTIIYKCFDCHHIVAQNLGVEGAPIPEYTFRYFSDAHNHMIQHPNHMIETIVEEDEQE